MNHFEMAEAMKGLFASGMKSPEAAHEANFALARLLDDWLAATDVSSARPFAKMNRLLEAAEMPPLPLWQIISEVVMAQALAGSFFQTARENSK